ncbi:MAG: hypothetical protein DRI79_01695 [Chloroflexi bacterium]|nr:MAG: hypothetical protein DRI80_00840 [Chloroflexota bacterium]RLC91948.1 MAG: hypothetical protein DRI79_01695 [Chloroflexota bacterium]HEY67236.1 hypothetical protein [Thermoflexia bacterium]
MKKWLVASGLVLALLLAVVPVAGAEGIRGMGELHAWGDGIAGVRGNGEVTVTGNGVLYFRDLAGDAKWSVSGDGERRDLPGGWITYYGFDGTFKAQGSRITVALSGYDVELWAEGRGVALLYGNGEYEVNGHHFFWRSDFEPIRLEAPSQ